MDPHFENVEEYQDQISFRRITAYELRRLAKQVEDMESVVRKPRTIPWWLPVFIGVLLTGNAGYIGIVHRQALNNSRRIDIVADEQNRRSTLRADMDELKRRILVTESVVQQMPYLTSQVSKIEQKVDRLLERRPTYTPRENFEGR